MKAIKLFAWMVISLVALMGTVFAGPIVVEDFTVQETNGDYILLVTLENTGADAVVFDEVSFTIEEDGTTKNMGVVKLEANQTEVFEYNLADVTDAFDSLVKGENYRVTVETSANSVTRAFLFGTEKDTEGLGVILEEVEINGIEVTDIDTLQLINGESVEVQLRMSALSSFDDARIMVFVEGYEHSPLLATTEIFSVLEGNTYIKRVNINLPADMDNQENYVLRIVGANDLSGVTYKEFEVFVDTQRHRVDILDLIMTPSSGVEPGQNIIANVRMKNRGQKEQDSVRVSVSIPELNVDESSYVSNLNSDEVATSDDMLLFIPEDATAKVYKAVVTLAYDDGYTVTTDSFDLNVMAPRLVQEENLIISFKNNLELMAATQSTFEIVVGNPNDESKPISVVPIESAWADVEVSPTLVMVQGGDSESFTVTITPKNAAAGEQELAFVVKEGASSVNEFTVATFVDTKADSDVNWFNVVLVVLLILAIIILLALVISIAKKRNDSDDDLSSTEEYY